MTTGEILFLTGGICVLVSLFALRTANLVRTWKILNYLEENHKEFWKEHGSPRFSVFFIRTRVFWLPKQELPEDKKLKKLIFGYRTIEYLSLGLAVFCLVLGLLIRTP